MDFQRDILDASTTTPVVVDFWAPWCGPCRALGPILEKLEREYAGRFKLVKVNSDENQELAAALNVRSIPYVVAFRGGKPVAQFVGALPEGQVRAFIEKTGLPFLASPMGKGVMDDNHPLSVGAARSHALQEADVIFLMGARLNWIMHFGLPPRFNKNVRIIQLDIAPPSLMPSCSTWPSFDSR